MKIEKGDILIGTCPYTGQETKYKYIGKEESELLAASGFTRVLIEGGTRTRIVISNRWAKANNLRLFKKGKKNG